MSPSTILRTVSPSTLPLGHELEAEWLRTVSLSNGLPDGSIEAQSAFSYHKKNIKNKGLFVDSMNQRDGQGSDKR